MEGVNPIDEAPRWANALRSAFERRATQAGKVVMEGEQHDGLVHVATELLQTGCPADDGVLKMRADGGGVDRRGCGWMDRVDVDGAPNDHPPRAAAHRPHHERHDG